jgi:hypothetical protein
MEGTEGSKNPAAIMAERPVCAHRLRSDGGLMTLHRSKVNLRKFPKGR